MRSPTAGIPRSVAVLLTSVAAWQPPHRRRSDHPRRAHQLRRDRALPGGAGPVRAAGRPVPRPARAARTSAARPRDGRMVALVASADGVLDPAAARKAGRPVLLVVGGHPRGRDRRQGRRVRAAARSAGRPAAARRWRAVTVVFVPVFNVDGHERFGPNQRPNQRGPAPDRVSHHRPEPEPEPRLGEGRRARDGGAAGAVRHLGSGDAGRPARHRRRQVRARRGGDGGSGTRRSRRVAAGRADAERSADGRA